MNDDKIFNRLFVYWAALMMICLSVIVLLLAADTAWRMLFK